MHDCTAHEALLPAGIPSLPMPDTRRELLWLLASLSWRRRLLPVPHGPLSTGGLPEEQAAPGQTAAN